MNRRRLFFVEPSKVGAYYITLIDGYIRALAASPAIARTFDVVACLSESTFANLSETARSGVVYRRIPVIDQDKHQIVRKSLLEFLLVARLLLGIRRGDVISITCIVPPATLLIELLNLILRRRGAYVVVHGEIEALIQASPERWNSIGFWGIKWMRVRRPNSLISPVAIDDFIRDKLIERRTCRIAPGMSRRKRRAVLPRRLCAGPPSGPGKRRGCAR